MVRLALLLLALIGVRAVEVIESDESFEQTVMASPDAWAVLFVSRTREENCAHAKSRFELVAETKADSYRFAIADVDDVKAFSSEFNVRKRMVPRLAVMNSRARLAEIVKLDAAAVTPADFEQAISEACAENPRSSDGRVEKVTLAIGGGGEEKADL